MQNNIFVSTQNIKALILSRIIDKTHQIAAHSICKEKRFKWKDPTHPPTKLEYFI